jgi:4-hydroxy-4-methyl-2-oxoglutarate aldolase
MGYETYRTPTLFREQRTEIIETFELKGVPSRIKEEHRSLLSNLPLEANVRLDHKFDSRFLEPLRERLPLRHGQNHAEVRNWHIMAIDGIAGVRLGRGSIRMLDVSDNLVTEQVEVDPLCCTPALRTAKNSSVKVSGSIQIVYWKCDVKWRQLHRLSNLLTNFILEPVPLSRFKPFELVAVHRCRNNKNRTNSRGPRMDSPFATLKTAGTAVIADLFDSMNLLPPVLDNALKAVGADQAFAGPAYTITGESITWSGSDRAKLAAIDNVPAGAVALWASMDAKGVCCFGDLLASAMKARGCIAAVVDGGVRDAAFLKQCGMPVISRYVTPAQGIGRWRVNAAQTRVKVRGALADWIEVNPGDIIVGDADGVIVIPASLLDTIIEKVIVWSTSESSARDEIQKGLPLLAALEKYGHL